MRFAYPASISQITSINDSFDSCILDICYAGRNRNQSFISKETIERAVPTMAYCPLVANYDIEADTIGGHDVDFVDGENGLRMVNMTDAIGVVPDNPQWSWVAKIDKDGKEREYLRTPVILWKRTPVYEKLKREGVSGQSMEINVKSGKVVDGLFEVEEFEFTAFCLLGDDVEPCFEGAQIEMFSVDKLSGRLNELMTDFKNSFTKVMAASADDNKTPEGEKLFSEGGDSSLNIDKILQKYGLTADDVNFKIEGLSADEIETRFAALRDAKFAEDGGENESGDSQENSGEDEPENEQPGDSEPGGNESGDGDGQDDNQETDDGSDGDTGDDENVDDDDDGTNPGSRRQYALTGEQLRSGILEALRTVMYTDEWGSWPRYCFTDYDPAIGEVYAYDNEDWNLYGFKYTLNGDNVEVDFNSKIRKKIAFVDFDNGDAQFSYQHLMDSANARFNAIMKEVNGLREYKRGIEAAERKDQVDRLFANFADLNDDERFVELRSNYGDMSVQEIEDKCFAIRGRKVPVKFSVTSNGIKLPVERRNNTDDEPYGGLFAEYGYSKN